MVIVVVIWWIYIITIWCPFAVSDLALHFKCPFPQRVLSSCPCSVPEQTGGWMSSQSLVQLWVDYILYPWPHDPSILALLLPVWDRSIQRALSAEVGCFYCCQGNRLGCSWLCPIGREPPTSHHRWTSGFLLPLPYVPEQSVSNRSWSTEQMFLSGRFVQTVLFQQSIFCRSAFIFQHFSRVPLVYLSLSLFLLPVIQLPLWWCLCHLF